MSKVFITGVTGLAGGHLARLLIQNGHNVSGVDIHESSLSKLGKIAELMGFYECDVRNAKKFGI